MLKYPARHYDESLKLKVSPLLWLSLLYAIRHFFIYKVASLMPFEITTIAWLNLQSRAIFIYCDLPALLVLIATGHRLPNAIRVMRWIWLHGKSILATSYLLSLGSFIYFNGHILSAPNTDEFLFAVVIMMTDMAVLVWLANSSLVSDIFAEFPEVIEKDVHSKVVKSFTTDRLLTIEFQRKHQQDLIDVVVYKNPPFEPFLIAEDALPETPLKVAAQFEAKNQLREAEWVYHTLLKRWPDFADAWHALGLLAYQAGKREHGIELVLEAMRLDGKSGLYCRNIGEMYRRMGRLDDAIHYAKLACKLSPDDVEAWHYYGLALTNAKRFEEAVAMYRKVVELNPKHVQCWNNLGVTLQAAGKAAEAEKAYKKALSLNAGYVEAQTNLQKLLAA